MALAEDANRRVEEENEALRQQLLRVQEQLQAIQTHPSPGASPQVALANFAPPNHWDLPLPYSFCSASDIKRPV